MNDSPQKQCGKCLNFYPLTPGFFYRDRSKKDRLRTICKECEYKPRSRKTHKDQIPEGMKQCSKCEQFFPATPEFFDRTKLQKSGLYPSCKVCGKVYYESHKEQRRIYDKQRQPQKTEYARQYRQTEKNKAYRREYAVQYHQEHPEQKKRYYERHSEEINVQRRQHRKDYPDLYAGIDRAHKHKRRAQKRASQGAYTPQQLQEQMHRQKSKCYYCKMKLGMIYHADHVVPLSRGGSNDISNIVIACPTCNMRKHARLPHEWPEGGRLL